MLPGVSPARSPLDFCELCLLAHDVECVLNAADRALWYARQAQAGDRWPADPRFTHYRVNIPLAVAVAYNSLRLPTPALGAYAAAVAAAGVAGPAALAFWLPHLHRGWINTLAKQPRFTLGDVTGLATQARRTGERRSGPDDALLAVLLAETEGRAYLQYGNLRKAAVVLADLPAQADRVPQIGPLHQAIIRKTVAGLHWKRGDKTAWADWIGQALTIGQAARLTHQVAGIWRTYGAAVAPILAEIAPEPPDAPA